ncbi:MAG TPA: NAD(P)-dependent oxidoreductase, partial [Salinimicrobium sp.]|nr:NAD(P)-dependent oxidoreductase [Salinimicrobium sp.]
RISEITVGLMGMGVLGTSVAGKLQGSGFNVQGWVRTSRDNRDSNIFVGSEELDEFLGKSQILICLLPLTPLTEGILNRKLFEKLPQNAYIINVARGGHLIEEDLLQMIGSGHLSGAALDVFRTEPLPPEHAFWKNPSISITPHIASVTNPFSVVSQILDNFELMKQGKELKNIVERKNGY